MIPIVDVKVTLTVSGHPNLFHEQHLTAAEIDMSEDEAKAIVGDGLARVSASLEMKDTNYGTGCGAHITVSLACDQNIEGIHLAHSIASALAEEFLAESFDSALAVFNHKIAEKH